VPGAKNLLKKTKAYIVFNEARGFFKKLRLNPIRFILPATFSVGASIFEGVSIGLLIPTIRGILENNFVFINEYKFLGRITETIFVLFGQRQSAIFATLICVLFLALIFKNVLQYISSILVQKTVNSYIDNLRKRMYARYLAFGKLFFDQHSSGSLYHRLIGFTSQVGNEFRVFHNTFFCLTTLLVYFGIMVAISWRLAIFTIAIFPLLHFSVSWIIKKIGKSSQHLADSYLSLSKKISNSLSCVLLVKAYRNEDHEKEWFNHASERVRNISYSLQKKQTLIGPVQEIVTLAITFLLVGFASFLLIKKNYGSVAGYIVFFLLLKRIGGNLNIFNNIRLSLAKVKGALREILKIFDDKGKFFIPDGVKECQGIEKEISFKGVDYFYPNGFQALKNITFSAKEGKTLAIVGATGSGKSTIINLIMRFYDPSVGKIKIDGQEIKDFTLKSLRSKISLVGQDVFLLNAPLRVNITYGLENKVSDQQLNEALKKAKLCDFVANLPKGLDAEIGERGVKLSGGQKQRVSICRAILKRAEIVLLDEATSALDSITEKLIQEALNELIEKKTTIVVAHRLSTIRHADKVAVIEGGEIVEQGSLRELLDAKGQFYNYWQEQKFY